MKDVQKFRVARSLKEKAVKDLDDKILYVAKENIEWRNSIIKEGHEESIKLLKELKELTTIMQKDLKCINVQCLKEDEQVVKEAADMVNLFKEEIYMIKESKSVTISDFTKVAHIESMLGVCTNHLEEHKEKVKQVSLGKEVWRQHILHIGLPHYQVIHDFSNAYMEWWSVHGTGNP